MTDAFSPTWLARFHAGERALMGEVYDEHYAGVSQAVGGILRGANAETVVHEVFFSLLSKPDMRRGFHGGSLGAWLRTVARNRAIDYQRRWAREVSPPAESQSETPRVAEQVEAKILIDRFRREILPPKWHAVFESRFLRELDQREAARAVGISRTTLAYQEMRIRALLRAFVLAE